MQPMTFAVGNPGFIPSAQSEQRLRPAKGGGHMPRLTHQHGVVLGQRFARAAAAFKGAGEVVAKQEIAGFEPQRVGESGNSRRVVALRHEDGAEIVMNPGDSAFDLEGAGIEILGRVEGPGVLADLAETNEGRHRARVARERLFEQCARFVDLSGRLSRKRAAQGVRRR